MKSNDLKKPLLPAGDMKRSKQVEMAALNNQVPTDPKACVELCMEKMGMRPLQYIIIALLCLGNMCDTVESGCIGPILAVYKDPSGQ